MHSILNRISLVLLLMVTTAYPGTMALRLEIYLQTGQASATVSIEAIGIVWRKNVSYEFVITDQFQSGSVWVEANYDETQGIYGFDWDGTGAPREGAEYSTMGYGLYKISSGDNYFFFDRRVSGYVTGGTPDFNLLVDGGFEYRRLQTCAGESDPRPWQTINNGDTLRAWNIYWKEDSAACLAWSEENPPNTAPFQPTNPTNLVGSEYNNHPRLTWTASSDPPWTTIKYKVWRRHNYGEWEDIAGNLTTTTYTDNSVTLPSPCGSDYYYRVRAYVDGDVYKESPGYSPQVGYIGCFPIAPTNLTVTATGLGFPYLQWSYSCYLPGVMYKVWRKRGVYPWTMIASGLTDKTYRDFEICTDAFKRSRFYYKVNAYNECGNSGYSNDGWIMGTTEGGNCEPMPKAVVVQDDFLPEQFALHSAYPNPFNPNTTIEYALPEDSRVRLIIYDVMGREVYAHTAVEESGYQSVTWQGRNQAGRSLPSGIYLYRLLATPIDGSEPFIASRKMLLLK